MTTTFEYDDFGQLIECVTGEVGSTTYQYDLNGNVIERDDGSVTTEYEWNDKNGLIGVAVDDSTVWQSTYYPDGKRYGKTNTDGTVYYLYDGGKPIGTYNTDWSRRESFGYGLGANDPIMNLQSNGTETAYYFVKDGLGNVNVVLNAQGATGGTVSYSVCGEPEAGGSFVSDIEFGAGGMKWDSDVHAYVPSRVEPEGPDPMGFKLLLGDCVHCVTEVGLQPWELDEEPALAGAASNGWPPFISPFETAGYPVILDAGDAGFGLHLTSPSGRVLHVDQNYDKRHTNGIDWLSSIPEGNPKGAPAQAIDEFKKNMPGKTRTQRLKFSDYDTAFGVSGLHAQREFELSTTRRLPAREKPSRVPTWRQPLNDETWPEFAFSASINAAGYRHQERLWPEWPGSSSSIPQGEPVTTTNRLKNDSNLGPHLHLFLGNLSIVSKARVWQHAAWQEKYFPSMDEIPLHIYLTAICRYGWKYSSGDTYDFDWGEAFPPLTGVCMRSGDYSGEWIQDPNDPTKTINLPGGSYSFGLCASECHAAVAEQRARDNNQPGQGQMYCNKAGTMEDSRMFDEANHSGCLACCDVRFFESLHGYHVHWRDWGLAPMDNLGNATAEGLLSSQNLYGTGFRFYQVPPRNWFAGREPPPGTAGYWLLYGGALNGMGTDMMKFWNTMTLLEGIYKNGRSCAEEHNPGYYQGNNYCPTN